MNFLMPSAVRKLMIQLYQHCTSYHETTVIFSSNPRFWCLRKSTLKITTVKRVQNKAISVNAQGGSFCHRAAPNVVKQPQKKTFSTVSKYSGLHSYAMNAEGHTYY